MAKKDFVARGSAWIPRAPEDGTSVTILSTKVLYQVSASPTDIPTSWVEDIKNAIQTDSKPYLWSKTIVAYSDNNKTITFSVSYKGKDGTNGTSFTPKGMADGFFNNMSSVPTYADGMDYDVYIVNIDDRSNPTSELPPYVCRYEYESLVVYHAEFGDGYNVNGHLYVANSDEWVDFGEIQGAKGEKGDDGMDAINIVFSPAELVFDADENGNLKQAEKSAEVKVFRGNKQLTYLTDWDFPNVRKQPGDNCNASFMVEENSSPSKPIAKIYDISSTDIVDTDPQAKVPASSGGINVPIKVNDVTYNAYLSFAVNVNTFAHTLIQDNKKYISKYTEVSNKYDAVSSELKNKADLKTVESTIEQTAENIKLEVLSKTSGRRNMLVNSAFRNQDSVFIHSLARIEKNTGVDGVNCIHSKDTYSGTGEGNYIGAFWDSTQKNGVVTNIPIVKGKTYVLSCWIKSDNLDLPFNIECLYMKSINQQSRDNVDSAISVAFKVTEKNKWQKISCVLDTNNEDATEYLAVNFWSNNKNVPKAADAKEYPTCNAYICKPMMEEGDTYSGWTLSNGDYDYVGGNILDNTRSLEKSGNLETEDSEIINEGYEYDYAVAHSNNTTSTYIEMLQWNMVGRINDGQDYMFSFLAKGTGGVSTYLWKDGTPRFFVESSNNKYDAVSPDGNVDFELTNEWKRYWVHYHLNTSSGHPLPEKLLIRCNSGNDVYVCQPKLEIGATMTEFTERKTDLVDKALLKKAGIEITTDNVKLYGDKVQVLTRIDGTPEYEEAGMFENGKFNAKLIDAINIVTQALRTGNIDAQNAEISNLVITGSMRSKYAEVKVGDELSAVDNINVGTGNDWVNNFTLSWESKMIGRTIRISNGTASAASVTAPADKKFLIDGEELQTLNIMPYSCVILHGYGRGEDFIYWVVENRYIYGLNNASQGGSFEPIRTTPMPVLSRGCVMVTYSFNSWNLDINQNTPSGQISISRKDTGWYRMLLPKAWSDYFKKNSGLPLYNQILVMLTGYGSTFANTTEKASSPVKATVKQIGWVDSSHTRAYVDVWTSDDDTLDDGSFAYVIYLMDYDDAISK